MLNDSDIATLRNRFKNDAEFLMRATTSSDKDEKSKLVNVSCLHAFSQVKLVFWQDYRWCWHCRCELTWTLYISKALVWRVCTLFLTSVWLKKKCIVIACWLGLKSTCTVNNGSTWRPTLAEIQQFLIVLTRKCLVIWYKKSTPT